MIGDRKGITQKEKGKNALDASLGANLSVSVGVFANSLIATLIAVATTLIACLPWRATVLGGTVPIVGRAAAERICTIADLLAAAELKAAVIRFRPHQFLGIATRVD